VTRRSRQAGSYTRIHSLTHSQHSLTHNHSHTHTLTYSLTYSLTHHSLIHSLTHSYTHSLTHSYTHRADEVGAVDLLGLRLALLLLFRSHAVLLSLRSEEVV
jgi:hypothetical protein